MSKRHIEIPANSVNNDEKERILPIFFLSINFNSATYLVEAIPKPPPATSAKIPIVLLTIPINPYSSLTNKCARTIEVSNKTPLETTAFTKLQEIPFITLCRKLIMIMHLLF